MYENEPEVRTDVVRSDDFEPDAVERGTTRNLVNSWKNRQQQQPLAKQVTVRGRDDSIVSSIVARFICFFLFYHGNS